MEQVSLIDGHIDEVKGDLISRSALGIGLCNPDAFPENRGYADGWNSAIALINAAPAVDAVEVVRCKDCMHCKLCYPEKQIDKEPTPGWYCEEHKSYRKPDDFCSCGERKNRE